MWLCAALLIPNVRKHCVKPSWRYSIYYIHSPIDKHGQTFASLQHILSIFRFYLSCKHEENPGARFMLSFYDTRSRLAFSFSCALNKWIFILIFWVHDLFYEEIFIRESSRVAGFGYWALLGARGPSRWCAKNQLLRLGRCRWRRLEGVYEFVRFLQPIASIT